MSTDPQPHINLIKYKTKKMNINHITIVGRLVRDPELKTMPSGNSVVNVDIATSRTWTNQDKQKQEETEFHKVVAYGKTAEIMSKYLVKGQLVGVLGRLKTRNWEGKDGIKRYSTEVIVESMQMGPKAQAKPEAEKIETIDVEVEEPKKSKVEPGYMDEGELPPLEDGEVKETTSDDNPL